MDALTQIRAKAAVAGGEPEKKRLVAVFTNGIKKWFDHGDLSNHQVVDMDVRKPVFSLCLRSDGPQMVLEFFVQQADRQ